MTFESVNINIKWLDNIYNQIITLQNLERMASEGCGNIGEYIEIPYSLKDIVINEARYKNLRFLLLELDLLVTNLKPIIDKADEYKKDLRKIIKIIDNKNIFLNYEKRNNMQSVNVTDLFLKTLRYVLDIKSNLIGEISHLLYIKEDKTKKW